MDDLVTWLRAQLDDDERKVAAMEREQRRVQTAPIFQDHPPNWLAGVDIFVSPERWRAEIDAKRRMIEVCQQARRNQGIYGEDAQEAVAEETLCLLALPYAARPGYREEWKP